MENLHDTWHEKQELYTDAHIVSSIRENHVKNLAVVVQLTDNPSAEEATAFIAQVEETNTWMKAKQIQPFLDDYISETYIDGPAFIYELPFSQYRKINNLEDMSLHTKLTDFLSLATTYETMVAAGYYFPINQHNVISAQNKLMMLGLPIKNNTIKEPAMVNMLAGILSKLVAEETDLSQNLKNILIKGSSNDSSTYATVQEFVAAFKNAAKFSLGEDKPQTAQANSNPYKTDQPINQMDFDARDFVAPPQKKNTFIGVLVAMVVLFLIGFGIYQFVSAGSAPDTAEGELKPIEEGNKPNEEGAELEPNVGGTDEEPGVPDDYLEGIEDGLSNSLFYLDAMIEGHILDRFAHANGNMVYFRYVDEEIMGLAQLNVTDNEMTILTETTAPFNIIATDEFVYYIDIMNKFNIHQLNLANGSKVALPFQASSFDLIEDGKKIVYNDLLNDNQMNVADLETQENEFTDEAGLVQIIETAPDGTVFYTVAGEGLRRYHPDSQIVEKYGQGDIHTFSIDYDNNLLLYASLIFTETNGEFTSDIGPVYSVDLSSGTETNIGDFGSFLFAAQGNTIYYSGTETEFALQMKNYQGEDVPDTSPEEDYQYNYYRIIDNVHYYAKMNGRLYTQINGVEHILPGTDYEALVAEMEAAEKETAESQTPTAPVSP